MYITATVVLLTVITVLAGITAVHAQTGVVVANDDTAINNGIDELAIDILANDIFEGQVSVTLEPDYAERHRPELAYVNGSEVLRNVSRYHSGDTFHGFDPETHNGTQIIKNFGQAIYNGTHLVWTPTKSALSGTMILVRYTYEIQDEMGRSDSANITIRITRPVASAAVGSSGPDPTFLITAYSRDPIYGRILDDAGRIIYNFTGIKSAVDDWYNIIFRPMDPPNLLEPASWTRYGMVTGTLGHPFDCDPHQGCARAVITGVVPEFDRTLEQGTYMYQFARATDDDYTGNDIYNGTFAVRGPSEPAVTGVQPDAQNRNPVAGDFNMNAQYLRPIHLLDEIPDAVFLRPSVQDPDGDNTTITSVTGATLGTVFDQYLSRGTIVYVPGGHGTDIINYTVSDGRGGTDVGMVFIHTFVPGNTAPVLGHISNMGVGAGHDLDFTATATDDDGNPLTFAVANAPDNAMISPRGGFSWTPAASQSGTHTVTIIVYDNRGGYDLQDVTLVVLPQDGTIPELTVGNITGPNGGSTMILPVFDGAVGRILEAYMSRDLVVFAGAFPASEAGTMPAGVARQVGHDPAPGFLLADIITNGTGTGAAGLAGHDITVSVSETGNVPPVLSPIGDYTINAQEPLAFRVRTTDYGGGTIFYMLSGAPDGAEISGSGIFIWTPGSTDVGNRTFTIAAYDRYGAATAESVTVRVLPAGTPNEPPAAPNVAATVEPGGRVTIIPAIYDPDGDPTRITRATGDARGAIMLSDNSIEYIAGPALGTETVTYTVQDSRGASVTGTVTITIQQ